MKKVTALLAILVVICSLCLFAACDPTTSYFDQEYLSDNVVSVELVNYDNPKQKHFISWVPDHTKHLKPFDDSKLSILETLDEDKIPDFIDTLCECLILDLYFSFDSPNGMCLKLSYSNGDFVIINWYEKSYTGYIGKFSSNGEVAEYIGCFASARCYEILVNDYFQTQI